MLILVIIAASLLVFVLIEWVPGHIVDGPITPMTQEDIQALREQYNLHRTVFYRYGLYMINLFRGDLGVSHITGQPVLEAYMQRLPATLLLAFSAFAIGALVAFRRAYSRQSARAGWRIKQQTRSRL